MHGIRKGLLGVVGRPELAGRCCNWHVNIFALAFQSGSVNADEHAQVHAHADL